MSGMGFGGNDYYAALMRALQERQQMQPQQGQEMQQSPLMSSVMQLQPAQFNMPQGGGGSALGGAMGGLGGMAEMLRRQQGGMGQPGGVTGSGGSFSASKAWGNMMRGGPQDGGVKS